MMNINSISHRHTISIGTHKEIIQTRKWRLRIRLINLAYVILLHRWRPCKHGQLTTDEMRHMKIGQFFPIFLGGRWGWLIFFPVSPFLSCHNNVFRHQMKNSPRAKQQHTSQSSKMEFRKHNRSGTSTMREENSHSIFDDLPPPVKLFAVVRPEGWNCYVGRERKWKRSNLREKSRLPSAAQHA